MKLFTLFSRPIANFAESFIDNVIKDKVTPKAGSVVYCDLVFGYAEHSGIYVGGNKIVHLNKKGIIEKVSPKEFVEETTAMSIYVSSSRETSDGNPLVAQ